MPICFWSMFISKPLVVLNFLDTMLVLEPLRVRIQWLWDMGDSKFKLIKIMNSVLWTHCPYFRYPTSTWPNADYRASHHHGLHSSKCERQSKHNKPKITPVSSTKGSFPRFQLSWVNPSKLFLGLLGFPDSYSPTDPLFWPIWASWDALSQL